MKFFFDTEFSEGFDKLMFRPKRHFIDLISIGIVDEDGREYYAVSNDFRESQCNDWVKENVLTKLPERYFNGSNAAEANLWKSNKKIKADIIKFICPYAKASEYAGAGSIDRGLEEYLRANPPEFYSWYGSYDWVLFCSLFGTMQDLPNGFPMYCHDLKQTFDEKGLTKEWKDKYCPEPKKEHIAIEDAKWNKQLYHEMKLV